MLILLPPSAGKTAPLSGPCLNLEMLGFNDLNVLRRRLISALTRVSAQRNALSVLGVGKGVEAEVRAQTALLENPCAPAIEVNTGVLYSALDASNLTESQLSWLNENALIFSGLFGVLRPADFIPAYRLAMGTTLPRVGNNAILWRNELATSTALKAHVAPNQLVVDCRSSDYRVWYPAAHGDVVEVRAFRETNGRRQVISHNAKHYRGLLANLLARSSSTIASASELHEFAQEIIAQQVGVDAVELHENKRKAHHFQLDLISHS